MSSNQVISGISFNHKNTSRKPPHQYRPRDKNNSADNESVKKGSVSSVANGGSLPKSNNSMKDVTTNGGNTTVNENENENEVITNIENETVPVSTMKSEEKFTIMSSTGGGNNNFQSFPSKSSSKNVQDKTSERVIDDEKVTSTKKSSDHVLLSYGSLKDINLKGAPSTASSKICNQNASLMSMTPVLVTNNPSMIHYGGNKIYETIMEKSEYKTETEYYASYTESSISLMDDEMVTPTMGSGGRNQNNMPIGGYRSCNVTRGKVTVTELDLGYESEVKCNLTSGKIESSQL